jgi:hypothetical protein
LRQLQGLRHTIVAPFGYFSANCLIFNKYAQPFGRDKGKTMLEFLPKEVRDGLEAARKRERSRKTRLRVQLGEAVFPVLRLWEDGFALDADRAPRLRGLVDVYDGSRHICQCLIVASSIENGELICDFKRSTLAEDRPALDFWRDENAPVGYLTRS